MAFTPAFGETGVGEAPRRENHGDMLNELHARPMSVLGPDSFRFSSQPALGGRGYTIEIAANGPAATVRVRWAAGHPLSGWRQTGYRQFRISREEYFLLMVTIDGYLEDGVTTQPRNDLNQDGEEEAVWVCADGPGYLSERNRNGNISWLSGSCGDRHPNRIVADMLIYWVFDRIGGE